MSAPTAGAPAPGPSIDPREALQRTIEHREIFHDEMVGLMRAIMRGEVPPALTAAILTGLRVKKETVGEIAAAASVLREFARPVEIADRTHLVDIVGTGGDGAHTFNISTASMFVAAAAGARVAKHGNRSVSSKSGAADVLEALGADIELPPEQVARVLGETGIGFMYAPVHHPAMKAVAAVRRELGVRTLFNILGPLANPADAPATLMGVFHPDLVGIQVRVLQALGAERALVVWGRDGMDELSLGAATLVGELRDGVVREYDVHPEDFGISMAHTRNLRVADAAESKAMLLAALDDTPGLPREIVALNAGAALYAAGVADSIADGIARGRFRRLVFVRDGQAVDLHDHIGHERGGALSREIAAHARGERRIQLRTRPQHEQEHDALARIARVRAGLGDDHRMTDLVNLAQDAIDFARTHVDAAHIEHAVAAAVQTRRALRRELDDVAVRPHAFVRREIRLVKARAVVVAEEAERSRRKRIRADELARHDRARALIERLHVEAEAPALCFARIDGQIRVAEHEAADDVRAA